MEKVPEILQSGDNAEKHNESQSGLGGPVEATFWATDSMTQWRLRGSACLIGPDIDSDEATPVRNLLMRHMRQKGQNGAWSWNRELTAHFGNLSPYMRGTFRNPPPGTPITRKPAQGLGLGHKVEDVQDAVARENFRVLVIVPEEMDRLDLSNKEKAQRWNYKLEWTGDEGFWKETELWP